VESEPVDASVPHDARIREIPRRARNATRMLVARATKASKTAACTTDYIETPKPRRMVVCVRVNDAPREQQQARAERSMSRYYPETGLSSSACGKAGRDRLVLSKTEHGLPDMCSASTSHGGFDDDPLTMRSLAAMTAATGYP
jgi:hypothetical protein